MVLTALAPCISSIPGWTIWGFGDEMDLGPAASVPSRPLAFPLAARCLRRRPSRNRCSNWPSPMAGASQVAVRNRNSQSHGDGGWGRCKIEGEGKASQAQFGASGHFCPGRTDPRTKPCRTAGLAGSARASVQRTGQCLAASLSARCSPGVSDDAPDGQSRFRRRQFGGCSFLSSFSPSKSPSVQ